MNIKYNSKTNFDTSNYAKELEEKLLKSHQNDQKMEIESFKSIVKS